MEKEQVLKAIEAIKKNSSKRKFKQSVDLIINLKDLDLKKPDNVVNTYITLHYQKGRNSKICALVGPELLEQARQVCDGTISADEFDKYKEKKEAKKLAAQYDYFIAQATIMPKIATVFGRVFGPRGKMPNPKAGCVVPPNANLKPLFEKLQKTIHVQTKNDPILQSVVGREEMDDEHIADNVLTIYNGLIHVLPSNENNIKSIFIKYTMGKPVRVDESAKRTEEQ